MKPLSDMPGPKGHLLTGQMPEMRHDVLGFFTKLAADYPDMARVRFLHLSAVSVHTPELVEEVLVHEHSHLKKAWDFQELRTAVGDGLLTSEGDKWKRQRALIQPSFHHERIVGYGDVMARRTQRRLERWQDGAVVDVHAELAHLTLEIVAEALFGLEVDALAEPIAAALGEFMAKFEELFTGPVPIPLAVPTPGHLHLKHTIRAMDQALQRVIEARRAAADKGDDLLGRMITAGDDEGGMSDQELRDELVTLLLAGHETTALALTYAIFLLAQHDDVLTRLHAEVDALPAPPGTADLDKLVYTRRVVDEALRLYPPAWGTGREVKEPFALGGYELPKGTQIYVTQWITHRDARWFDDPLAFKPERFENPAWPKSAYFPFGAGPRKCIGFHFALLEAVLVLGALVRRYRFELVDDPAKMELMPTVTVRPRNGLKVRLRARS